MTDLISLVNEQAEDEGLWFIDATCSEAYLQAALRKLHAAVEARAPAATPPGHTDLMVTPESIDAILEAHPLPQLAEDCICTPEERAICPACSVTRPNQSPQDTTP